MDRKHKTTTEATKSPKSEKYSSTKDAQIKQKIFKLFNRNESKSKQEGK
jgi:hypothetical protein